MKKLLTVVILMLFFAEFVEIFAQTTSTRTSTTSGRTTGTRSRTGTSGTSTNYDTGGVEIVVATVTNMLRHPDKQVRMQALQSLVGGMTLGTTTSTGSSSYYTGVGDIFGMRGGRTTSSGSSSRYGDEGLGTTAVIPEFFTMLADPDPEIRDLVSIALDQIFGTDTSLLRFMNDPDPVVRKYAIRLFVIRTQEGEQYRTTRTSSSSGTQYGRSANDILIMRILLNMAKDPDPDVKKVAEDALEKFISNLEQRYQQTMGTGQPGGPGSGMQPMR
ncbi:MAG: HEAT repeat domain-containing protein [bacterium]|nr:HEAT repeat domain-containing protein [bacterium]